MVEFDRVGAIRVVNGLDGFALGGESLNMSAVAEPLIDYLRQLERQGETHVHLDDRSRLILREFFMRARGKTSSPVTPKAVVAVAATPEVKPVRVVEAYSAPVAAEKVAVVEKQAPLSKSLDGLKQQIAVDAGLKSLGTLRDKLIFSSYFLVYLV